jgi:DNA polymerase III epsilon subunit-like protein
MALIIDVETTGLPVRGNTPFGKNPDYKQLESYDNCRIVQITFMLCNEKFEQIDINDSIIKSNGFTINNSDFHGITDEISQSKGVSISEITDLLYKYLKRVSHIVAHNADFDISVIKSELFRLDMNHIIEEIEEKNVLCTMNHTKDMVNAKNKYGNKYGVKYPSLSELYKFTMNEDITNAHNSKYDVINLHCVVKTLYDTNKLNFNEPINFTEEKEEIKPN